MGQILRKQFIAVHSSPLITTLSDNFARRYPHRNFPKIPKRGDFDLNEINEATYFFS